MLNHGLRLLKSGHSSGGASLARAAFGQGHSVFEGIILVDPIIAHPHTGVCSSNMGSENRERSLKPLTDRGPLIDRFAKSASMRQTTFSSL